MNRTARYKFKQFRFKRWSRARYAAFASLSGNITIGVLKSSISDLSLQKNADTNVFECPKEKLFYDEDSDDDSSALIAENILLTNNVSAISNIGGEQNQYFVIIKYYKQQDAWNN